MPTRIRYLDRLSSLFSSRIQELSQHLLSLKDVSWLDGEIHRISSGFQQHPDSNFVTDVFELDRQILVRSLIEIQITIESLVHLEEAVGYDPKVATGRRDAVAASLGLVGDVNSADSAQYLDVREIRLPIFIDYLLESRETAVQIQGLVSEGLVEKV